MVNKEEYKKLKQMDRIEYLLLKQRLEEDKIGGNFKRSIYLVMGIYIVIAFFQLAYKAAYGELLIISPIVYYLCVYYMVFMFFVDIIAHIWYKKQEKEIENEFFNFEVKARK